MTKRNKERFHDLKLSLFSSITWLMLFSLILSGLAVRHLLNQNLELEKKLQTCQHNFEVWSEQVETGHVVIELKGGIKEGQEAN